MRTMRYQVGQLVWITTSYKKDKVYSPPALIVGAYEGEPRIFTQNEVENTRWITEEGLHTDWVYDIMYEGQIELGVSSEWLRPYEPVE